MKIRCSRKEPTADPDSSGSIMNVSERVRLDWMLQAFDLVGLLVGWFCFLVVCLFLIFDKC